MVSQTDKIKGARLAALSKGSWHCGSPVAGFSISSRRSYRYSGRDSPLPSRIGRPSEKHTRCHFTKGATRKSSTHATRRSRRSRMWSLTPTTLQRDTAWSTCRADTQVEPLDCPVAAGRVLVRHMRSTCAGNIKETAMRTDARLPNWIVRIVRTFTPPGPIPAKFLMTIFLQKHSSIGQALLSIPSTIAVPALGRAREAFYWNMAIAQAGILLIPFVDIRRCPSSSISDSFSRADGPRRLHRQGRAPRLRSDNDIHDAGAHHSFQCGTGTSISGANGHKRSDHPTCCQAGRADRLMPISIRKGSRSRAPV